MGEWECYDGLAVLIRTNHKRADVQHEIGASHSSLVPIPSVAAEGGGEQQTDVQCDCYIWDCMEAYTVHVDTHHYRSLILDSTFIQPVLLPIAYLQMATLLICKSIGRVSANLLRSVPLEGFTSIPYSVPSRKTRQLPGFQSEAFFYRTGPQSRGT